MTRSTRLALAAACGLVLAACGKEETTRPTGPLTGTWSGSRAVSATTTLSLNLTLSQSDIDVTGTGTLASGSGTIPMTVDGTFQPITSNFSLTLNAQGFAPINYSGNMSGDTMTGTLNGSGYNNLQLTLDRQ